MATLNGGFSLTRDASRYLSTEDRDLVNEFIRTKGINHVQPGSASSNEAARATNLHVTKLRRDFRSKKRAEAKLNK